VKAAPGSSAIRRIFTDPAAHIRLAGQVWG
jgi:hypothetical protein